MTLWRQQKDREVSGLSSFPQFPISVSKSLRNVVPNHIITAPTDVGEKYNSHPARCQIRWVHVPQNQRMTSKEERRLRVGKFSEREITPERQEGNWVGCQQTPFFRGSFIE